MHTPSLPQRGARRHLSKLRARLGCTWRQLCLSRHAAWLCGQLAVCKVAHRVGFCSVNTGPWEPLVRSLCSSPGKAGAPVAHRLCGLLTCSLRAPLAAQDAPHERCVAALLSPPWMFVHQARSPHFFLKLMTADHLRSSDLAELVGAYSLEACRRWPAYGLEQRKVCSPSSNSNPHFQHCSWGLPHRRSAARRACATSACSSAARTPQPRHRRSVARAALWPCICLWSQWCAPSLAANLHSSLLQTPHYLLILAGSF